MTAARYHRTWPTEPGQAPLALIRRCAEDVPRVVRSTPDWRKASSYAYHVLVHPRWTVTRTTVTLDAALARACVNGHPRSAETGKPRSNGSWFCQVCYDAARDKRTARGGYLPTDPIVREVEKHGGIAAVTDDRDQRRAYQRMKESSLATVRAVDVFCCEVLRVHPMWLYGDVWLIGVAA